MKTLNTEKEKRFTYVVFLHIYDTFSVACSL